MRFWTRALLLGASLLASTAGWAQEKASDIVIGFAVAKTGLMKPYDEPATRAAMLRIEEINAGGGLLNGRKIRAIESDTKSDMRVAAQVADDLLKQGAEMLVVSCDFDFGAPAAKRAQAAGKISFFLCAEDIKAGLPGVGSYSFSASILSAMQGAVMVEWAYKQRNVRSVYVLMDTAIEYTKAICTGFDWVAPKLPSLTIVGRDTLKTGDTSVEAQMAKIAKLPAPPDAIMFCGWAPSAPLVMNGLRKIGNKSIVLGGSAMDGSAWLKDSPGVEKLFFPVQASVHADDPGNGVREFNVKYARKYGAPPANTYVFPGYILIELWAQAVQAAQSVEADKVKYQLETMRNIRTLVGNRSFSPQIHIQNQALLRILEAKDGKMNIVDQWMLSQPLAVQPLLKAAGLPEK
ncbi:ABC transporter substrate-binding protein [Ottowia testudinis]|uniref:ABC transporter substrate-binding protein n=1 Tax=Ottowia testudinis TaxID=2816950 RepID=A0A975CHS3_9BURK|nr:ABC transporter substrate-binding protein [Ottowia testudinis]QTD46017.1 ABC transporter substrate-binding protein [Ottowia testudinis]